MSIRQINQSHRYSNVKYIVKSHNMFGIYHRMRFRCVQVFVSKTLNPPLFWGLDLDVSGFSVIESGSGRLQSHTLHLQVREPIRIFYTGNPSGL